MVAITTFTASVVDATNGLLRPIAGWASLKLNLKLNRGGTWQIVGPASSGLTSLEPGTRLVVQRTTAKRLTYAELAAQVGDYSDLAGLYSQLGNTANAVTVAAGPVTRVEDIRDDSGHVVSVTGVTGFALLADRIKLINPERPFNDQEDYGSTSVGVGAYTRPDFDIERLVVRQLGMGAMPERQVLDSRVGTKTRNSPRKSDAQWTDVSTAGVTWAGDVATVTGAATAALRTTNAFSLGADEMAMMVARIDVSGPFTVALYAHFNGTAAGAAPGQAGVVTQTRFIHVSDHVSASLLWSADAFIRPQDSKPWVRFQINVQRTSSLGSATVEFLDDGGVFVKTMAGTTLTPSVSASPFFTNVADEVDRICQLGNLNVSIGTSTDGDPQLLVRANLDRSASVRLSQTYGNVASSRTVVAAPKTNSVLVLGPYDADPSLAYKSVGRFDTTTTSEWSRRTEAVVWANTTDADDLNDLGDEELSKNGATAGWSVEVIDVPGMSWPEAYDIGDTVTVITGDVAKTDVVVGVEVEVDDKGERVRPILGSSELADSEPALYAAVRDLRRRLDLLEGRS